MAKIKKVETLFENDDQDYDKLTSSPGWENKLTASRKLAFKKAATAHLKKKKKDSRVNLRVESDDVGIFRELAEREGIGYQTLMVSVLHKFAQGSLVDRAVIDEFTASLRLKKVI
jgi:predicted DNA binding CopG/RHH family protein